MAKYSINYLNSMINADIELYDDYKITIQNVKDQPELLNYIPYDAFGKKDFIFISDVLPIHRDIVVSLIENIVDHIILTETTPDKTKYILNKHLSFFTYGNSTVKMFIIKQITNFINTHYSSLPFLSNYGSLIKERLQTKNNEQNTHIIKSSLDSFVSDLNLIYSDEMWIELTVSDIQIYEESENNIDTKLVLIIILNLTDNNDEKSDIRITL